MLMWYQEEWEPRQCSAPSGTVIALRVGQCFAGRPSPSLCVSQIFARGLWPHPYPQNRCFGSIPGKNGCQNLADPSPKNTHISDHPPFQQHWGVVADLSSPPSHPLALLCQALRVFWGEPRSPRCPASLPQRDGKPIKHCKQRSLRCCSPGALSQST